MKNRECPASCYVGNAKQELVYRAITDFAEGAYYDIHRDEVRNKTKIQGQASKWIVPFRASFD